jgi:CRP-like cAMP-binding protein
VAAHVSRPRIAELAVRHPEIALNAMRIMGGRAVELQERLKELQTERVERRVAHILGRLRVQAGRRTGEGIAPGRSHRPGRAGIQLGTLTQLARSTP